MEQTLLSEEFRPQDQRGEATFPPALHKFRSRDAIGSGGGMQNWMARALLGLACLGSQAALGQTSVSGPEVEACQASGLIALKERNAAVHDVIFEPDTLSVTKADTSVGDTKIKTVIIGLADIQTSKKDKPHQFVCLIGEKGKVLLTFFTEK